MRQEARQGQAQALLVWGQQHWMDRDLPWRLPQEHTIRKVLVEALLAQTQAEAVAEKYAWIFEGALSFSAESIARVIERAGTLGLPRLKALALQSLFIWVQGPMDLQAIWGMPGIGPYTWGMVATLLGERAAPVDCNVQRVGQRVCPDLTPDQWIGELMACIDGKLLSNGIMDTYVLISTILDVGATLCKIGTAPRCGACPLAHACAFQAAGSRQMELW